MHPILLSLPHDTLDLSLHTYGLCMALGFALGVVVARLRAPRLGLSPGLVYDVAIWGALGGVLGARGLYWLVQAPQYYWACVDPQQHNLRYPELPPLEAADCWAALRVWRGGLVWYGAFLGAALAVLLLARRRRISFARFADLVAPSLPLGHSLGRIGCFFAGCCWGKPTGGHWGLRFPAGGLAWTQQLQEGLIDHWAESSLAVHPTQLYEAFGEALIFLGLLILSWRRRPRRPGALLAVYGMAYAILRALIEVFRGDQDRGALFRWGPEGLVELLRLPEGSWLVLSTSQAISLGLVVAALLFLLWPRGAGPDSSTGRKPSPKATDPQDVSSTAEPR